MGKLTTEVFSESCCDGDSSGPNSMSARPCGCDPGEGWICIYHNENSPVTVPAVETVVPKLRTFETGATRDINTDKYDYEGFLSPIVLERFAAYMHKNRIQSDGSYRASDNWQKGIPKAEYLKSAFRHFISWWKNHRAGKSVEDDICGVIFNAQGYLFEVLKKD